MEPLKQSVGLLHPYPSIHGSYGGNQSWFANKTMCQGGCGVVAAGDLLLYLSMYRKGCRTEETHGLFYGDGRISKSRYERYLTMLRRRYLPVLPRLGMPYWVLVLGLNRYFSKHGIALRARWGVLPWNMEVRMKEMLQADIPVILAIGPNFPLFFRKQRLGLYVEEQDTYRMAAQTKAHFVVATAMREGKVRISSWGKSYVVDWEEYKSYVRKSSNYLMSNLCYIYEIAKRK